MAEEVIHVAIGDDDPPARAIRRLWYRKALFRRLFRTVVPMPAGPPDATVTYRPAGEAHTVTLDSGRTLLIRLEPGVIQGRPGRDQTYTTYDPTS